MSILDRTDRCPLGATCEACGGTEDLAVATAETPVGVFCLTLCGPCRDAGTMPASRSWSDAIGRVAAHCGHLGIDADQMAAALEREHDE